MKYESLSKKEFFKKVKQKKIICYGASRYLELFLNQSMKQNDSWYNSIIEIVDNSKAGQNYSIGSRDYVIKPISELYNYSNIVILITPQKEEILKEIILQLESMELDDTVCCWCLWHIVNCNKYDDSELMSYQSHNDKVPKIIHTFWFSGDQKPQNYIDCINSWKQFCPEYEIIEWNMDNYNADSSRYFREALSCRAWAYASDYARLDVVSRFGGIYLDMDVEVLKSLDPLLKYEAFFSKDIWGNIDLGSGFGASKGNYLVSTLLSEYDNLGFERYGNEENELIPQPRRLLNRFIECGLLQNSDSQLINNTALLSPNFFKVIEDPSHNKALSNGNEYAIHWHNAGWFTEEERKKRDLKANEFNRLLSWLEKYFNG